MYSIIIHPLRKLYKMGINEYCIVDQIWQERKKQNTQGNEYINIVGKKISKNTGISDREVYKYLSDLSDRKIIERLGSQMVRILPEWDRWFDNDCALIKPLFDDENEFKKLVKELNYLN